MSKQRIAKAPPQRPFIPSPTQERLLNELSQHDPPELTVKVLAQRSRVPRHSVYMLCTRLDRAHMVDRSNGVIRLTSDGIRQLAAYQSLMRLRMAPRAAARSRRGKHAPRGTQRATRRRSA
jgi:DNA-binding IclR family transcriptional regulator